MTADGQLAAPSCGGWQVFDTFVIKGEVSSKFRHTGCAYFSCVSNFGKEVSDGNLQHASRGAVMCRVFGAHLYRKLSLWC